MSNKLDVRLTGLTTAGRLLGRADQLFVIVRNSNPENQDPKDVKHRDSPECLPHSSWNILPRLRGLAKGHANHLRAGEGKAGLAHACPPAEESSRGSFSQV